MIDLFSEFNRVILALQEQDIRYSVVGALAVAIYGGVRATEDMDLLVDDRDSTAVRTILEELGYLSGKPWKFSDTNLTLWRFTRATGTGEDFFILDILLAQTDEFRSIIANAHEEEWGQKSIRVARKEDLIWMKTLRNSHSDRTDIEFLSGDES